MKNPFKQVSLDELNTCPVCDSSNFTNILTGDRYDMKIQTCMCQSCNFIFTNPYPSEQDMDLFYSNHYWHYYFKSSSNANEILNARKIRCENYLEFIMPEIKSNIDDRRNIHFIDIGGGEGIFTGLVKDKGIGLTYLVEPSKSERDIAKNNSNADFIISDLNELNVLLEEKRSDEDITIFTCTHVLEHVSSIDKFFQQLEHLIKDDDFLYIDVPDVMKYEHIKEIHIAHKWHFSISTLAQLFLKFNYYAVKINSYSPVQHPKSVRALFKKSSNKFNKNHYELDNKKQLLDIFENIKSSEIIWNSNLNKFRRSVKKILGRFY